MVLGVDKVVKGAAPRPRLQVSVWSHRAGVFPAAEEQPAPLRAPGEGSPAGRWACGASTRSTRGSPLVLDGRRGELWATTRPEGSRRWTLS